MRNFGLATLSLITLTLAAFAAPACSGSTTVISRDGTGTETPGDGTGTDTPPAVDPSTQGDPTSKDTPSPPLVQNLAITDVAILQGVKVPIVTEGAVVGKAKRNAPVVTARGGLVRVYVAPATGYKPVSVTAELRIVAGNTRVATIKDTKTIAAKSADSAETSTFNFEVTAEQMTADASYQIFLTQTGGVVPTGSSTARFPNDGGVASFEVETAGALKIVIVPVVYNADSSGRAPDVSTTQLAKYKEIFMARYPVADVSITAREPYDYAGTIAANGNGFSQILQAITNLRRADGVGNDVYYYGAFAPKATFSQYCQGGCVTGLSTVVQSANANNAFLRASVGVGYTGEESITTAAHEVGHAHGRSHAPCGGASGVDSDFPYSDGSIGVWGYDILSKTLIDPAVGNDMMGYCQNEWVSDYTFAALFDRVAQVNGGPASAASGGSGSAKAPASTNASAGTGLAASQTYKMAIVDASGNATWGGDLDLDLEPDAGETREVTFQAGGQALGSATAHFYPYDHLPGGVLVMPATPKTITAATPSKAAATAAWSSVKITGLAKTLAR